MTATLDPRCVSGYIPGVHDRREIRPEGLETSARRTKRGSA